MGWNRLEKNMDSPFLEGFASGDYVYFVHSFYVVPDDNSIVATTTDYGESFVSSIATDRFSLVNFIRRKAKNWACAFSPTSAASSDLRTRSIMLIIPAIDLKDGRCVRLFQGEMDQETVYFDDPRRRGEDIGSAEGASFLHIVDLNGAVEGRPVHTRESRRDLLGKPGLSVELGGGLRSIEAVQAAFDLGVARVVIGTAAYDNRGVSPRAVQKISRQDRRRLSTHARGKVAVKGWKETTAMDAVELAQRCEARRRGTNYLHRHQP